MKTFRVSKACSTAALHEALEAAGVAVVTVRGAHRKDGEPALCAVVVTPDGADAAKVAQVIEAHTAQGKLSEVPSDAERNAELARLEKL